MLTSIVFYSFALLLLVFSTLKDKEKTKKALKKSYKSFMKLVPALLPMVLIVGILLTFITPDMISRVLGKEAGWTGILIGLVIGSVSFLPSFVAFPLGGTLIQNGAGYSQVAIFLASAMSLGIASIVIEVKYFNKKMTAMRNILALTGSLIFAIIIGMVM